MRVIIELCDQPGVAVQAFVQTFPTAMVQATPPVQGVPGPPPGGGPAGPGVTNAGPAPPSVRLFAAGGGAAGDGLTDAGPAPEFLRAGGATPRPSRSAPRSAAGF